MQCPGCNYPDFIATGTCPRCGFYGDHDQIEERSRLEWLMGEMDTWVGAGISKNIPKRLHDYYRSRLQKVQSTLGMYFSPFSKAEASQSWRELRQHQLLLQKIESVVRPGSDPRQLLSLGAPVIGRGQPVCWRAPSGCLCDLPPQNGGMAFCLWSYSLKDSCGSINSRLRWRRSL